jgi:hypothetical protein
MNTQHIRRHLLPTSLAALALAALVGCADRNVPADPSTPNTPSPTTTPATNNTQSAAGQAWDNTKNAASDAYDSVRDATTDAANRLERATYDERMAIKANLTEAGAKLDAELAEWRRDGRVIKTEAQSEIAEAKSEFNESLDELGEATAQGWQTAKAETAAAWTRLKAAYANAKAE